MEAERFKSSIERYKTKVHQMEFKTSELEAALSRKERVVQKLEKEMEEVSSRCNLLCIKISRFHFANLNNIIEEYSPLNSSESVSLID